MEIENESLISYLKGKLEHFKEILRLTEKQQEAISSDNIKELNLLITAKVNQIRNIKRLDKLNARLQEEIISKPKTLILYNDANSLIEQIRSIITKLIKYDHDSMKSISASIGAVKTKLDGHSKRIRTSKLSGMKKISTPRFIDVLQ